MSVIESKRCRCRKNSKKDKISEWETVELQEKGYQVPWKWCAGLDFTDTEDNPEVIIQRPNISTQSGPEEMCVVTLGTKILCILKGGVLFPMKAIHLKRTDMKHFDYPKFPSLPFVHWWDWMWVPCLDWSKILYINSHYHHGLQNNHLQVMVFKVDVNELNMLVQQNTGNCRLYDGHIIILKIHLT